MPRRRMCSIAPLAASAATVPPWPSGLRNSESFSASSSLPVFGVDRRHRALAEQHHIVLRQPEPLVLVRRTPPARRASPGWSSCRSAPRRRSGGPRRAAFSKWICSSDALETGPIGIHPLGWSNPSRLPCPPATSSTPISPARSASAPRLRVHRLTPTRFAPLVDRPAASPAAASARRDIAAQSC